MHTFSTWSVDVRVVFGVILSFVCFFFFFFFFFFFLLLLLLFLFLVFFFFFYNIFPLFRLSCFQVRFVLDSLWAPPPIVIHRIFWSYASLFYMVWRCGCCFRIILLLFFLNFFHLFNWHFSRSDYVRIDTLWAQLLLQLSTDHFETMHTCSIWSEDVRVIFGLFCNFSLSLFFFFNFFTFFDLAFFMCDMMMWVACGCNFSYSLIPFF